MKAREYFEQILDLENRLNLARDRLDQLEERIDGMGSSGNASHMTDNNNASWVMADRIARLEAVRDRWASILDALVEREDEAIEVITAIQYPNIATLAFWRQCLWLRYIRGYKYSEISEMTGHTLPSIEYAISSALKAVDAQGLVVNL